MRFRTLILFVCCLLISTVLAEYVEITSKNHDEVMQYGRISFVAFTAEWCPFSRALLEVFKKAAKTYKEQDVNEGSTWANVNCVSHPNVCLKYGIDKYPTMKVFFYGYYLSEYRSTRSVEGLIEYVKKTENEQSLVEITPIAAVTEWQVNIDPKKATIVLWYPRSSAPYKLMIRAIALVHDVVNVLVPAEDNKLTNEEHFLLFAIDSDKFEKFPGAIANFNEIADWIRQKTLGLVRELNFKNVEGIIEEGKPLLILFRSVADKEVDDKYAKAVRRELGGDLLTRITPLMTDGVLMQFPLLKLGKIVDDMPILLIDTFVHVFVAPFSKDQIFEEGNIRKFVNDFISENLHRRFHGLPEIMPLGVGSKADKNFNNIQKTESVFKKLEPAKDRYSFAKQEL